MHLSAELQALSSPHLVLCVDFIGFLLFFFNPFTVGEAASVFSNVALS